MTVYQPRGDVKRLPKWAQEYVESLTREVSRQYDHITELSSRHSGSNVVLDSNYGYPSVTLPPDSTIRFYMGDNREDTNDLIEIYHNRRDSRELEVRAYGARFLVIPRVSNGVSLRLDER